MYKPTLLRDVSSHLVHVLYYNASLSHGANVWAVKQKYKEITVSIRSSRNVHSECTRELCFTEV